MYLSLYIYIYIHLSLFLSLSLYIYIYMYVTRLRFAGLRPRMGFAPDGSRTPKYE